MADNKLVKVIVSDDDARLEFQEDDDTAAIVGLRGFARTGTQGISYAGENGQAISVRYGIAIVGPGGTAEGGAGCVVCAYDGGSASGGDGSVAWARRDGPATVGGHGAALTVDSHAVGGAGSVAVTLRQNSVDASATAGPTGVALVHNHPALNPASGPATAIADRYGVAIAFDDNYVKGALGALLVAAYPHVDGYRFAVGVVDGTTLIADQAYTVNDQGEFVCA